MRRMKSTAIASTAIMTIQMGCTAIVGLALPPSATAQESDADLAKKLANPISSLVSLPFQFNYDCCIGPEEASKFTLNVQPVIPISLNADWNMIVRTIVPVVYLEAPAVGLENEFGLSDTLQSFFFSPSRPVNGITWGIGPAFLWPTGAGPEIATGKWGAGPTGVILRQQGGWTYGLLANHVWSYADSFGHDRPDVSQTFLQPFVSHTFPDTTNISINTESTYDWETEQWTVPINAGVSHVYKFGEQRVSLGIYGRVYAVSPDDGPDWGARAVATFLFPKK